MQSQTRLKQLSTPVFLPGKSPGQRNLAGYNPWGRKSQTRLSDFPFTFHFYALEKEKATHSSVLAWRIPGKGELGGLPSLGSQSQTRLKQFSSSSSSINSLNAWLNPSEAIWSQTFLNWKVFEICSSIKSTDSKSPFLSKYANLRLYQN